MNIFKKIEKIDFKKVLIVGSIIYSIIIIIMFFKLPNSFFMTPDNPEILNSDQNTYHKFALRVLTGNGMTSESYGNPVFIQPGYCYLIAFIYKIFGITFKPLIILNIIMLFSVFLICCYMIKDIFHNNVCVILFMTFFIMNYNFVKISLLVMTESFGIFLLIIMVFFMYNYLKYNKIIYLIFSGIFLGFLSLVRLIYIYLPFIIFVAAVIYLLIAKKEYKMIIKSAIIFFVFAILVLVPTIFRNYYYSGEFKIGILGGLNLYYGTNADYDGLLPPKEKFDIIKNELGGNPNDSTLDFNFSSYKPKDLVKIDDNAMKMALKNIIKNPKGFFIIFSKNLIRQFLAYPYSEIKYKLQNYFYIILNSIALVLFIWSLILFYKFKEIKLYIKMFYSFLYIIVIYTSIGTALSVSTPRYGFLTLVLIYFMIPITYSLRVNKKIASR